MSKHKYKPPAVRRGGQRPPGAALESVLASTATALVCVAAMLWARRSSSVRPAPAQSQYGWLQVEADEPLLKSRSNVAAVDARNFTAADVVEAILAEPGRPLLLRGAMASLAEAEVIRDRAKFLAAFGDQEVGVGVGFRMSTRPVVEGLFHSWIGPGRGSRAPESDDARRLRADFEAMARRGVPPTLPLRDAADRIRGAALPHDSYAFAPVDETPLANQVPSLMAIWRALSSKLEGADVADGTLFGFGGRDSGLVFHAHRFAIAGQFAGHKKWFIYDARRAPENFVDDSLAELARARGDGARLDSMRAWSRLVYPLPEFSRRWRRFGLECVQAPDDVLYVPEQFAHATLNLDEAVSLSLQGTTLVPVAEA